MSAPLTCAPLLQMRYCRRSSAALQAQALPASRSMPASADPNAPRPAKARLGSMEALMFSWQIIPSRLDILRKANGAAWQLGEGGYGTVGAAPMGHCGRRRAFHGLPAWGICAGISVPGITARECLSAPMQMHMHVCACKCAVMRASVRLVMCFARMVRSIGAGIQKDAQFHQTVRSASAAHCQDPARVHAGLPVPDFQILPFFCDDGGPATLAWQGL